MLDSSQEKLATQKERDDRTKAEARARNIMTNK